MKTQKKRSIQAAALVTTLLAFITTHFQYTAVKREMQSTPCPPSITIIRGGLDPPLGQSGFGSYFFVEISGMIEDQLLRSSSDSNAKNFVVVPRTDSESSYFNKKGNLHINKWSRYFQPINGHLLHCIDDDNNNNNRLGRNRNPLPEKRSHIRNYNYDTEIHIADGRMKPWPYGETELDLYGNEDHLNNTWYKANRLRGNAIVSKYFIPQPSISAHINQLQSKLFAHKHPMLGIHMRGTDKMNAGGRIFVSPETYVPYIKSFQRRFPSGGIFVATDDAEMLRQLAHDHNFKFQSQAINRETGEEVIPFTVDHPDGQEQLGVEIMTDIYLLSQCDYLLHGVSAVIEAVMYLNLELHENSINLDYTQESSYQIPWAD